VKQLNDRQREFVSKHAWLVNLMLRNWGTGRYGWFDNSDLAQEAYLRLCLASHGYDERLGTEKAYARSCIKHAIIKTIYRGVDYNKALEKKRETTRYSTTDLHLIDYTDSLNEQECDIFYNNILFKKCTVEELADKYKVAIRTIGSRKHDIRLKLRGEYKSKLYLLKCTSCGKEFKSVNPLYKTCSEECRLANIKKSKHKSWKKTKFNV